LTEDENLSQLNIGEIVNKLPESNLTVEQKYTLAYMWNEEKLAKDIYLALNDLTPHQTLYNIATRSEVQHEAEVENLVQKYDINITNLIDYEISYSEEELRALAPGQYTVPEVQELYNTLYAKGSQSLQDALEVGCNYWAFDRALKNIGVSEGCCSLGEEYCKTEEEFPSSNGQGNGYRGGL